MWSRRPRRPREHRRAEPDDAGAEATTGAPRSGTRICWPSATGAARFTARQLGLRRRTTGEFQRVGDPRAGRGASPRPACAPRRTRGRRHPSRRAGRARPAPRPLAMPRTAPGRRPAPRTGRPAWAARRSRADRDDHGGDGDVGDDLASQSCTAHLRRRDRWKGVTGAGGASGARRDRGYGASRRPPSPPRAISQGDRRCGIVVDRSRRQEHEETTWRPKRCSPTMSGTRSSGP